MHTVYARPLEGTSAAFRLSVDKTFYEGLMDGLESNYI